MILFGLVDIMGYFRILFIIINRNVYLVFNIYESFKFGIYIWNNCVFDSFGENV